MQCITNIYLFVTRFRKVFGHNVSFFLNLIKTNKTPFQLKKIKFWTIVSYRPKENYQE